MLTFGQLFNLYYTKHVLIRTRCPENAWYFFNVHGPRWEHVPVTQITKGSLQDWVDDLAISSKSAATRAINMVSAIINWGIRRGYYSGENPCRGVERFRIQPRERFMTPDEFERFNKSLRMESKILRDFFWICVLTGARRGKVQEMRWNDIDMRLRLWRIPVDKNGDSHTVALSPQVMTILNLRKLSKESIYVFPGEGVTGHLVEPKRAWKRVLGRADIEDLRIHDLRRTLGSYLAISGASPYIIAKALGHKDQRSTAIYARLDLEPVRCAVENVHDHWITPS